MDETQTTILVVDDDPSDVDILIEYLEGQGYAIETTQDGLSAWELLEANPEHYDVVILDRMMPGLDGLEVLERIKSHPLLQSVPVILQTALAAREQVLEGLRAGAQYYLTKPFDQDMLLSVVSTAAGDRRRYRRALEGSDAATRTFGLMQEASFRFRTLGDALDLATVLANAFPEPRRAVIGLSELLVNAVEHGNLEISYLEKRRLRDENRWEQEVQRRLADPALAARAVEVSYRREPDRVRVTIRDEGAGFDWRQYLEIEPSRAFDTHGRGIALSCALSFDRVEFRGTGSEVEVSVMLAGDVP